MLLSPERVVALCKEPAHAAALAAGRLLEAQHRLHVEGTKDLLEKWVTEEFAPGTPNEQRIMRHKAKAITKSKFGPFIDAVSKVFTARGTSYYYEFRGANQQADFEEYLRSTQTLAKLQQQFQRASITGFQGVFLVDLPAEPNPVDELPQPYVQYMPSSLIHDGEVRNNRYEYIIFKQTRLTSDGEETYYVCLDDENSYVVDPIRDEPRFRINRELSVVHGLGYVPAFAPTLNSPTANETTRTSIFDRALPVASEYLTAYNNRILTMHYHAFQKFWAFGVPCNWQGNAPTGETCNGEAVLIPVSCGATGYYLSEGREHVCPRCNGMGKFIPVGADKTFILEPGAAENGISVPPAGYITPDDKTWIRQDAHLLQLSKDLEVAALSKEGITSTNTKQETALAKQLDAAQVNGRRDEYGDAWKHVVQSIVDTKARFRYGQDFVQSAINIGRKYDELTLDEQEDRYSKSKAAGVTDSLLFGYLEDLVYTKYSNDPVELEYNRIKLYLDPVPTRSVSEVQAWLDTATDPEELADLRRLARRKRRLNDYVARFERENGPLVQFGIRVRFEERINNIKEAFDAYDSLSTNNPIVV